MNQITYKFYEEDKRLTIMYWGELGLIQVVSCNPKDQFSKKTGRMLILIPESNKQEFNVEKNLGQRQFIDWCEKKYQKMYSVDIDMNAKVRTISTSKKDKLNGSVLTLKFLA